MQRKGDFNLVLKELTCIATIFLLIIAGIEGELSESESKSKSLFEFIRSVDPDNRLGRNGVLPHPCSHMWKGVKCNFQATNILEIRLENMNLSGIIDADSLCKLQNLQVLSLANNLIRGNVPNSILHCTNLTYLNLSSNLLSGKVPLALIKLKNLKSLDISNNHFEGVVQNFWQLNGARHSIKLINSSISARGSLESSSSGDVNNRYKELTRWLPLVLVIGFFLLFTYFVNQRASKIAKEREILKSLGESPLKIMPAEVREEGKPVERQSELVFFVEDHEKFRLEDLLEATADLRNQSLYSSLYKVTLKNNATYAVKRLKKLQVSFEEFRQAMRQIGSLKHPNILPLVGYNSSNEEKLLIYKYQSNGSLLNLLESYIEGKRDFPWGLRLSIASGIARGLDFIYQRSSDKTCIIPHGNLKLSNILMDKNEEPLISEHGITRFLDPKRSSIYASNGYTAPEKNLTEEADVFSFGVILLELLTGKAVERSGIDLPKWVKAMVREEWTGEVFDKEVNKAAKQWAFPLLNIALKCVSHSPENRPSVAEVLEKIEEVLNAQDHDHSVSSVSSFGSHTQDCCLLHTVIPESWDTPGSNH